MSPPGTITNLLNAWIQGEQSAYDRLIPLVYAELRKVAKRHMAKERSGHILQTTALINEAYIRLTGLEKMRWQDRTHFIAMASRLMRRILVEYARRRSRLEQQEIRQLSLDEATAIPQESHKEILALNDALETLSTIAPRQSQVVELRYFGGLSTDDIAEVLKVAPETVRRDWKVAKAWLRRELSEKRS